MYVVKHKKKMPTWLYAPSLFGGKKDKIPWWLAGGIAAADCVAAYQAKGAADYAASKVNLANAGTYDAYEGDAPSWNDVDGWVFDGSGKYLLTASTQNVAVSSTTIICRFSSAKSESRHLFELEGKYRVAPNSSSGIEWFMGKSIFVLPAISEGVVALMKYKGYRNGVLDTDAGEYKYFDKICSIGASINGGWSITANIQAFAVYKVDLPALQVMALTDAMNAL